MIDTAMADGDVVRKITISATGENIDSTTASVKALGDATDKTSAANDNSTKSSGGAKDALVSLAAGIYVAKTAYEGITTASDGASDSIGRATMALASAFGAVLSYAPNKVGEIWQEGIDKLNSYVSLSQQAGSVGVEYYQRLTKAATDAGKPADDYLKIINNINTALDRKLGTDGNQNGSTFNTQVLGLQKNGNLQGQTADVNRVNNAVTGTEQLSASLKLIQDAEEAGEKLVALQLAGTLLGPEAANNLKNDNDYIYQMQKSIDSVKDTDIIKQADVDRAVAMQKTLDDSQKIIDSWFTKSKSDWSGLGTEIQQLWVNANENLASALTILGNMFSKAKEIANVKPDNPETSIWTKLGDVFNDGTSVARLDDTGRQLGVAQQTLASQLGNPQNVKNARQQTQKADDFLTPDQSSPAQATPTKTKDLTDYNDAVDRAINSLTKHTMATQADADAVGLGAAALAGFKVDAAEDAAVLANHGKETDAQVDKFGDLKDAAMAAADALAKAQVASQISRGSQLAFASPEDVQIANSLAKQFGDNIPAALASSQAAALRFNNVLSTINTTIRGAATSGVDTFVAGLVKGEGVMQSLKDAATDIGKALTNAGLNSLVTTGLNALAPTASQTAGATSSAAILTTAGTALAASMVAGATSAAAILAGGGATAGTAVGAGGTVAGTAVTVGGAAAGTTVGAGGVVAGAAVTAGGVAAGAALWGPIAALAAVAAGVGLSLFGGSSSEDAARDAANKAQQDQVTQMNADAATRRQQDQVDQANASISDPNSLNGQLQAFDLQANQQRIAEVNKGAGAIVELEQSLAAQREAIIQKSNEAIEKTMTDFLNSVKTGSQSILSPQAQLAYEQNLFNTQLAGAQGGNSDDLNALTATASALLTLAQNFYASGTGYADTYNQVTSAISSIASGNFQSGSYADPNANTYTADNSMTTIDVNGNIEAATVSGMAMGGIVGNGVYNKDSVVARYANGGSIALAGGEAVTRATSVNANTIGMLNHINQTGKTPNNDNSDVIRVLTQGFNGQTQVLSDKLDRLAASVQSLNDTTRQTNNKRRVPGTKAA